MLRLVTLFALLATVINEVRSLDFDLVTAKAPWSARASTQLTRAASAFTYTYNGAQQTAPANSFLIYGSSDFRSNDVWLSTNKGITWIPIAGNGTSYASFTPTRGAASTTIGNTHFRISGERASGQECLKTVFQSTNGQTWTSRTDAAWGARMWASTIVDSDKNLYLVGGRSCGVANSFNDIWKLPNGGSQWTQVTGSIPFGGPRNAVAGSAYNEPLRRDVFYHFSGWSGNQDWNDVHVSSDKGVTWNRITATAPWRKRDDATGFVLPNGVLVLVGGKSNASPDVYHNDIWVSLNGGYHWGQCNEDAAFTDRRYSTTAMDENGYLYVAAGESNEGTSELMNDVWKSRISFLDTAALVRECNVKMPRCGKVGLSCWPGSGTHHFDDEVQCPLCGTEGEYLNFVQQTARAPWAARAFANMESFPKKLKYTPVGSNFEVEIAKGALVMQGSGKRDENDVWVSTNYGRTWALIAGISRYGAGGVVNAGGGHHLTSFANPGPFATSYGFDEKYGYMYRIGGEQTADQCYRTVYNSNDGVRWNIANPGGGNTFQPLRKYASAATDSQGQVYITGGTSCGGGEVYNDVWKSADRGRSWVRQTDKSPWEPRLVHMLLGHKGNRAMQSQDILWVLGGWSSKLDFNDVWASTDQGKTWDLITLSANWPRRDDFNAEVTKDGLLIVSGGKQANPDGSDKELFNDVWVSADGGYTWGECVKDALFSDRRYQMTLVDDAGYFIIAGGQEVVNGQERLLNDVWRSSISFNDLPRVAKSCDVKIPQCGVGLSCLPGMDGFKRLPGNCGVTCLACPNTCTTGSALDFVRQAINAPWSARSGGSMEQINKAITYTSVAGNTVQVPAGAIVLHGESGRRENDVWITTNQGQTWQLIAGISRFGRSGEMKAGGGHDMTSFQPTADPAYTMDSKYNLYRIGGANNTDTFPCADAVWMSTNGGVTWQNQYLQQGANLKRRITPPRQFAGAIWGTDGAIYVTGGRECNKFKGMNDVWRSTDQGKNWILMTDRAPWAGRLVHQMLSIPASQTRLGKEILVIMSGWLGNPEQDMNDVWASSDHGRTWAQITGAAKWPSRDDANAEVTARGLLVLTSGKTEKPYTIHNDVFVSADGGYTWGECIRDAAFSDRRYQMTLFDNDDYLYVAGGTSDEGAALNDVWRSTLPFSDVQVITSLCGISIPTCGIGLNCWPDSAGFRILDNNRGATCNLCQNKPDNPDDPSGDDDYSDTSSSSSTGAAGGAGAAPKIGTTTLIIIFAAIAVILLAILYFARQWRNNQAAQIKQQQMQQSMPSTEMSTSLLSAAHPPASTEHIQV